MLEVVTSGLEVFDNYTQRFSWMPEKTFRFEYSLKAISDWEAKWCIPFLGGPKTVEQSKDMYKFMCVGEVITDDYLVKDVELLIIEYMEANATATRVQNDNKPSRTILTSEVIYAYMANAQVPFTCETWNIKRLLILLNVISEQNNPDKKKMSNNEILKQNRDLNAERKKKYNTKG
ncbi:MAG: hypothetical protein RR643_04990 [Anaerorhabdus sp.]|uniref:hypothetical protein n=1 Tax=Anaerorhabdus sp. TaxID=1872524 RepID=UPI002FCBFE37